MRTSGRLHPRSLSFTVFWRVLLAIMFRSAVTAMAKRIISTPKAPAAVGPYNQAVITNGLMFCSGQIGFDPESMKFVSDEVEGQTEQCLKNMLAVLEAGGAGIEDVVKTTVFVAVRLNFSIPGRSRMGL
uniref:Uncharacterized protein n=1 Tax=Chromera velia CCMP2878 TaxID=1169474 RepID=A0A0G4I319_9ALVE|eukprot:Cvel_10525.t1-p1 / transcript=Cvel_10525.t1 / gene=Cvel_10525 / organism=Chromera_velia_CCMP2878 / gene_product=RutC family protein slr0709, putative / transcript_product=RutC family protein slr0709, putative / location=Cvel_scaffold637:415-1556(-) / protein_length=128 / sequence_SO=supercontig / SO=protein_coding / is_pseudo=false